MLVIDKLCYTSGLRYVNGTIKFLFAVATIFIVLFTRSFIIGGLVLLVTGILTVHYGGIPFKVYLKLMGLPLIFLLLSVIAILITVSPQPLSFFSVPFGGNYLTINPASGIFVAHLIITAFACVSCLYFLALSTPMTNILTVLKRLKCPKIIIELMLLIYRFIFILFDFATSISQSQKSRLGNRTLKQGIQSMGLLGSSLLVKAFKRSSQLYDAMESRCYDGEIKVLEERSPVTKKQIGAMIAFDGLLLLIYLIQQFI